MREAPAKLRSPQRQSKVGAGEVKGAFRSRPRVSISVPHCAQREQSGTWLRSPESARTACQSEARESAGARATQKPNFHAAGASGEAAGAGPSPPCWNRSRYFPFCTLSRSLGRENKTCFQFSVSLFLRSSRRGRGKCQQEPRGPLPGRACVQPGSPRGGRAP